VGYKPAFFVVKASFATLVERYDSELVKLADPAWAGDF
jgi:hypothetical protein